MSSAKSQTLAFCAAGLAGLVFAVGSSPAMATIDMPNAYRDWASLRGLSESAYEKALDDYKKAGFRPIDVEVTGGSERIYAVIFRENAEGLKWEVRTKLTDEEFGAKWDEMRAAGFRLIDQESYVVGGTRYFGGLWVENKAGLAWASNRMATSSEMGAKYDEYRAKGLMPIDIDAYPVGNDVRYSSVWVKNTDVTGWILRRNLSGDTFGKEYDANEKKGYLLIDTESYLRNGQQQYAAIWVKEKEKRDWVARRDMDDTWFHNWWAKFRDADYRLEDIEAYPTASGTRYAGIWVKNEASGPARQTGGGGTTVRLTDDQRDAIDCAVESFMAANPTMGYSVAIALNGEAVFKKGYGWADKANSRQAHSGTIYRTASVAKAITGTLGFILYQKGQIELNKRVDDSAYLPNIASQHTYRLGSTLSNRSRVHHYCDCSSEGLPQCSTVDAAGDHVCDGSLDDSKEYGAWESVQAFMNDPLVGDSYKYSTPAYTVFAAALEAKTGKNYCAHLVDEISNPQGLSTLRCEDRSAPNAERSEVYYVDGSGNLQAGTADNLSWKYAGGGLEASAYDLMRFGVKLEKQQLFSADTVTCWFGAAGVQRSAYDCMLTKPDGASDYGYGWNLNGSHDGYAYYAKSGGQLGSRAYLRVYPNEQLVIATMGNTKGSGEQDLATELARIILQPQPANILLQVSSKSPVYACPKNVEVRAFINYPYNKCVRPKATFRFSHNGAFSAPITREAKEVPFLNTGKVYQIEEAKTFAAEAGAHTFGIEVTRNGQTDSAQKDFNVTCPPFEVSKATLLLDVEKKDVCKKKVRARVTLTANQPKTIHYRLRDKTGAVLAAGSADAEKAGNVFVAKATKVLEFGAYNGPVRLEAVGFPNAAAEKLLTVQCLQPLKGTVTLRSVAPNVCRGEALVAIQMNSAGQLPYELECGLGRSWQRTVKAPPQNKIGVDKVLFAAKNNERVTCILRTRIDGELTPLSGASYTFKCGGSAVPKALPRRAQ